MSIYDEPSRQKKSQPSRQLENTASPSEVPYNRVSLNPQGIQASSRVMKQSGRYQDSHSHFKKEMASNCVLADPSSRFGYQPHRANDAVFEDHLEQSSSGPLNSKIRLFSRSKTESKSLPNQNVYRHRQDSTDSLELMPTIAIGYENSMDKQLRRSAGELRITGTGYYFEAAPEDTEEDMYDQTRYEKRQGYVSDQLYEPEVNQRRRDRPIVPIEDHEEPHSDIVPYTDSTPCDEISEQIPTEMPIVYTVEDEPEKPELPPVAIMSHTLNQREKRPKLLKRLFKSRNRSKKPTLEFQHTPLVVDHDIPSPVQELAVEEIDHRVAMTDDPVGQMSELEPSAEVIGQNDVDDHSTFVDLLSNIPVVSQVFQQIDDSESLSTSQKLVIKLVLIVLFLYEVQSVIETVGSALSF